LHIVRPLNLIFKALADPIRRQLLDRLRQYNGLTLNQLCEDLDITRQGVAKHLLLLEKAKLMEVVWHGRKKRHYLNPLPIQQIYDRWLGKYGRRRLHTLKESKKRLEEKA
jgi:DNA-binding transcriptional ArsR family regulator